MNAMRSAGLFDLQVNGYAGVDFNDAGITADRLDVALEAMQASGVTLCLPTIITAPVDVLRERLAALDAAVAGSRLGAAMVPGYHLEGPFLNSAPGFAGCHPPEAMIDPDIALVEAIERGLSRPILLMTLAPERDGAMPFIEQLVERGKVVAMAHSNAGHDAVRAAVAAGMTLSTHLGNGLPQQMHKLDNPLLAQLAEPGLAACLIADGHHVSPQALGALVRIKGMGKSILVTDAVLGAAAPAGEYLFAGMAVERTVAGAMVQPGRTNLAGSALCLDQAVRNIVDWGIGSAKDAMAMASINPMAAMARALTHHGISIDSGLVSWTTGLMPNIERPATISRSR